MKPVELERFWHDNAIAIRDPFGEAIPQFPMAIGMGYFAMFAELGIPQDMKRLEEDYAFACACAKAYNDRAEAIVGHRLLNEQQYDPTRRFPHVKEVGELFGCRRVWQSESYWLLEAARTPQQLETLLDQVDRMNVADHMLPSEWDEACARIERRHGLRPVLGKHLRGPVTLAMSIYGVENLIFLIMDEPDLAARFRDTILRVVLDYFTICDRISGDQAKPGFSFADDNCAMLTPEMYAFFGQPILKAVFDRFAPNPRDRRFQHSDSDMAHLLPLLAETGLTAVNFGPNLRFSEIRTHMPNAVVIGTLAPFTFMRNNVEQIAAEVRRDMEEAQTTRGLVIGTAGSVNDGTRLTSLRAVMHTVQCDGRLQPLEASTWQ